MFEDVAAQGVSTLLVDSLPLVDQIVRFVCRRGRCRPEETEEFAAHVRLRLLENDYAILRQYAGRSSLRSYLSVVIQRLFIDARRERLGVWRPSAEARRMGPIGIRLDTLMYRDRLSVDQAITVLRTNERVAESESELHALAARLPLRERRQIQGEAELARLAISSEAAVEQPALASLREERARAVRACLREARAELPHSDALLLRLRYEDGLPVARVAELLDVPAKPLYRRIEQVLSSLRVRLEQRGVSMKEVQDVLGQPAFEEESFAQPGNPAGESVQSHDGEALD
jgi:RNA polymerase sigma factor (sigma-70 family)